MPPDADADGWKKMVCGATTAASEHQVFWALDAMYASSPGAGPAILALAGDANSLAVATRTPLPIDCGGQARNSYCNAAGMVVDGATLWVGVNEYLGTPESWASFENDGGTLDDLLVATGGRLWVPGTSEGRYAQSCTPAPPPPALAGTPDLPPYCAYKESPKALVARVALADGGNATIGDVRDVAASKLFVAGGDVYAVEPGGQGGALVVRYDAALEHAGAKVALPVVPMT
ncbi:hypothetical protein JL720_16538 [Aureococcus anophagefferens]|nr:hypothetical protein JL720_16538 [Aureococcus anophagefferens]